MKDVCLFSISEIFETALYRLTGGYNVVFVVFTENEKNFLTLRQV